MVISLPRVIAGAITLGSN